MNTSKWLPIVVLAVVGVLAFGYQYAFGAQISGFVASHHDLVKGQRDRLYADVAGRIRQPKTIILLSPNHYDSGRGAIQTTTQTWEVTDGKIAPNLKVIQSLQEIGATGEPDSFINEHGIHLQLADIHQYFPGSRLVPIILKDSITYDQVNQLEKKLDNSCHDCLLIASVDFSHYQPAILADLHDQLTERYLDQTDSKNLMDKAEVNCPSCLAALSEWAIDHHTNNFHIKDHTNSGILVNDLDIETTTHFFGWYQKGPKVVPQKSVSFIFGGNTVEIPDMTEAFSQLGDRTFWGTDGSFLSLPNVLSKSMDTATKYLKISQPADADFATVTGNGTTLRVIRLGSNTDIAQTIGQIETLRRDQQNRVVVFDTEKISTDVARRLVDAGAQLVIGSDTSIAVTNEVYKGSPIFYSLGNFLSNSWAGSGYLLAGEFVDSSLNLFALPIDAKNHQPYLIRGSEKQNQLGKLYQPFLKFVQNSPYGQVLAFPEK